MHFTSFNIFKDVSMFVSFQGLDSVKQYTTVLHEFTMETCLVTIAVVRPRLPTGSVLYTATNGLALV